MYDKIKECLEQNKELLDVISKKEIIDLYYEFILLIHGINKEQLPQIEAYKIMYVYIDEETDLCIHTKCSDYFIPMAYIKNPIKYASENAEKQNLIQGINSLKERISSLENLKNQLLTDIDKLQVIINNMK